jgi:TP901 family phage tail tape measure protein
LADRIKGITIEIGGDTTGLSKALGGVNKEIKSTQSQLKDVERLLKLDPSNTELLSQKQKLLTQAVADTKDKLDTLKTAESQVQQQFAEGKINQQQYDALKREIIETSEQLKTLEKQAENANATMQKISLAGDKFQEVGGKISGAGQKMLPVTAAITGLGAASVAAAMELDDGYDTIITKTGATGEALEGLNKVADNIFSTLPTTMDNAGTAVGEVNTRFGATGDVLEDLSAKFIKFAEINGTDLNNSIGSVDKIMEQWNVDMSETGNVLGIITKKGQDTGISVDTLMDSVQKNGATFKEMGLNLSQSIDLLAQFESNGVNAETAIAGLKKAVKNYTDDGKSTEEALKLTIDSIKSAKTETEALSKAQDVFGTKGAAEMSKAIREGRINLNDLTKSMSEYGTVVEDTFEATLDPWDDATVATNNLKLAGADLGNVLLKTLQPIITSTVNKIKEFTTWFKKLSESQKETIIKVAAVVAALGPMLIIVGKIATGIGAVIKVISTLSTLLSLLSVAGGPILLTVAAITALSLIMLKLKGNTKDYRAEAEALTEQETSNKETVDNLYSSYQQMNEQRQSAAQSAQAEAQHEQELLTELQSITDENGNVKMGYEERARFITGQLADALGIEIKMTGDQIQNYKDLTDSIDKLILKKEANALLSANEAEYAEAIKNRTDAYVNYSQAQKDVEDTTKKLADAQKTLNEEAAAITDNPFYDMTKFMQADETVKGYNDKLKELKQTLTEAQDTYIGYNTTIQNYEGLSAAIISGNQQAISDAITNTANQFQTAETATRDSLERQTQTLTEKYESMKSAVEQGAPGITQAQVDQMAQLLEKSKIELDKLPGVVSNAVSRAVTAASEGKINFQKVGTDFSAGLTQGIVAGQGNVIATAAAMAKAGIDATRTALDSHSPSRVMDSIGQDLDSGFANGISAGKGGVISNVISIIDAIKTQLTSLPGQAVQWGADMIDGLVDGIKSKVGAVTKAIKGVAENITSYIHFSRPDVGPLREYEKWMPDMVSGLAKGIKDNAWKITDQLKGLTGNMSYMLNGDASGASGTDLTKIEGLLGYYLPGMSGGTNIVLDDGALVGKMLPNIDTGLTNFKDTNGRNGQ